MKPDAFEYFKPTTLSETFELLERHEDEAKIIAGGQSLVPIMNFRLARPGILVDINGISDLDYIKKEGDELVIGTLTREADILSSPLIQEECPLLSEAVSFIGHAPIRNRGTIGGSLVHADPSAEIPTAICALNGKMKVQSSSGERTVESEEFFLTYLTTSLEPTEILVEIRIPVLTKGAGWSFQELTRRSGDFAIAAGAAILRVDEGGICREVRLSLGGVAPTPFRASEAEDYLDTKVISEEHIEEGARRASEEADPDGDYHASAEFRKDMARVFAKRALQGAWKRANGGE